MLMVCHHLNPRVPEDLAFAESRIRATTIAAEDVLHDLGAISMIGSDSQAMGRAGETIIRTWQTAHAMKARFGRDGGRADNERARRYVAKYTICPAVAHGLDAEVGSVEVGKLADLVLWDPRFFGVRPHAGAEGRDDRLGADRRRRTRRSRRRSRCSGGRCSPARAGPRREASLAFVAPAALEAGSAERLGLRRAVRRGRRHARVGKADMPENTATPEIRVEPDTFRVWVDGEEIEPRAGRRAAAGPAVLPVLSCAALAAAADRLALPGRRLRALGRARGGGRGRARTSTACRRSSAGAAARRRVAPRPASRSRPRRAARDAPTALLALDAEAVGALPEPDRSAPRRHGSARSCCAPPRSSGTTAAATYREASRDAAAGRVRRRRRGGRARRPRDRAGLPVRGRRDRDGGGGEAAAGRRRGAARWLVEAAPLIGARRARDRPDDRAASCRRGFAPALELRSLAHAAREGRLFAS